MANTFNNVVDKIFARSLLTLRRAVTLPARINTNWGMDVAKRGDTINVPIPSAATIEDVTPGPTPPGGGDTAPTTVPIVLDRWRGTSMHLTDKEAAEIAEGSDGGQLSAHMDVIAKDVNSYLFGLYPGVYGFAGAAGTTPFGADHAVATEARKVLNKQSSLDDPRHMVCDPDAMANALGLRAFLDASFRGDEGGIRDGTVGRKLGFSWGEDNQVPTHARNALGAGALTVNGVHAIGVDSVSIAKAAGASWEAKRGDVIRFAGDEQTYVVREDTTVVHTANTAVPISPALKVATAGGEAVTVEDTHVVNLAFHRDAFALAVRPLAPAGGFSGGNIIRTGVDLDTRGGEQVGSGLAITLEVSREHYRTKWAWSILYGGSLVRPELAARVAG